MTNIYEQDRVIGIDMIMAEVRQFNRLNKLALSDLDIAHRMALSLLEVRKLRRLVGGGDTHLANLTIPLRTRVLLGELKISHLRQLLDKTDKELLAIRGLGPKTLKQIKAAVSTFVGD